MKWKPPKWYETLRQRGGRTPGTVTGVVACPRCRREVRDIERGREAHKQSCVKIPRKRPAGWGVRTR